MTLTLPAAPLHLWKGPRSEQTGRSRCLTRWLESSICLHEQFCIVASANKNACVTEDKRKETRSTIAANASISAAYSQNLIDVDNDWVITKVKCQGIFGIEYGCRAYRALQKYLGLKQSENLFITNKSGKLSLYASLVFLIMFYGKPPIKSTSFWSLIVYGADQYLVPNELGRYVIGDRSTQSKYENGDLVYGDDDANVGDRTADGRFQVLLQPADISPPRNWTSK